MDSENIEYDYEKYEKKWSSIFTPAETLSKRKRVCNDSGLEAYMQNYLYKRTFSDPTLIPHPKE